MSKSKDREADLHYAFQFGQGSVRNDNPAVTIEFKNKFGYDAEDRVQFDKGVAHEQARKHGDRKVCVGNE